MNSFDTPAYYLDLDHSLNCASLESVHSNKSLTVLVRREDDRTLPPIKATGRLLGEEFHVEVVTSQGKQSHVWTWEYLRDALAARRH